MDIMKSCYQLSPIHSAKGAKDAENRPLRSQKAPNSFLIKSRTALTIWTWFIFVVTVLTCTVVIVASIFLMMDCRSKLQRMRSVLEHNDKYCTNMGLQVMFACCFVLFAVFGLGCIGRQMTGYAMLVISGVAIFQSTMTLVFDECKTGVKDDFMTSITSSIESCRLGSSSPPFELLEAYAFQTHRNVSVLNADNGDNKSTPETDRSTGFKHKSRRHNNRKKLATESKSSHKRTQAIISKTGVGKEDELLIMQIKDDLASYQRDFVKNSEEQSCDKKSAYISILAFFLSTEDVNRCVNLCHIYHDFCGSYTVEETPTDKNINATATTTIIRDGAKKQLHTTMNGSWHPKIDTDDMIDIPKISVFDNTVRSCGSKMWGEIRKFCFYDNVIFMPLSLGGPLFYIVLSLAFMYVGHCDQNLNDGASELKTPREQSVSFLKAMTDSIARSKFTLLKADVQDSKVNSQPIGTTVPSRRGLTAPRFSMDAVSLGLGLSSSHYGPARGALLADEERSNNSSPKSAQSAKTGSHQYLCVPSSLSSSTTMEMYISDSEGN